MGANWCCHCGYMLPLGRRNAKKCTECNITCHATCAHLVPDFCGMSNERANYLLAQIRDIKDLKTRQKSPTTAFKGPTMSPVSGFPPHEIGLPPQPTLDGAMGDMRLGPDPFAAQAPQGPPLQTQQQQQQMPYPYTASPTSKTAGPRYPMDGQPPARPSFEQPPGAPSGLDPYQQYQVLPATC